MQDIDQLAVLVNREQDTLLSKWRLQVKELPAAKALDTPTLNDHIPQLIGELAAAFRAHSTKTIPEALAEATPPAHGAQRLRDGFDIEEVVAEYNILRGCIHDLAHANGLSLQGQSFHILNRVLDGAIALAVKAYAAQRALEVQQRRDEYLAFVAHDLRTPLNAISLAARVLEIKLPEHGTGTHSVQLLKTLRRNVQYLDGLVGKVLQENASLLAEAAIKLERRLFDLWPLVESLIHDLNPTAETAGTKLVNEVPHDLVVDADASLLGRVFQNLIANAISYTPNGTVSVGARELPAQGAIESWVTDNGSGIPPDRLAKVFDKFETDPQRDDGTGLGLAIVKTFLEAHGGKVTAESTQGQGSTFRFVLPARQSTRPATPEE